MAPVPNAARTGVYAPASDDSNLVATAAATSSNTTITTVTATSPGVAAPHVDRVYDYGRHFKLDKPFTIRLKKGETVLLPLEPIHDLLFPSPLSLSSSKSDSPPSSPFAIGLELSNCAGSLQSFVVLKSDRAHSVSTASYQCVTVTHANEAQQQLVNLCPQYDPGFPVAMRVDPAQVKGFVLRADVAAPVETIALLRSTKSSGGFATAFVVSDVEPRHAPVNMSFSYPETTLSFAAPTVWHHTQPAAHECDACEYTLLAEKLAPNMTRALLLSPATVEAVAAALTSSAEQLALPYCVRQRASVQYELPKHAVAVGGDGDVQTHHDVKLDGLFADRFHSSGEYRFVLLASLPNVRNHQHAAMLAYAPQQLVVTVPSLYQSHFFIAFVVVVLLALAAVVHMQYRPHRCFLTSGRHAKASPSDVEDEAEFVSLLARVSSSPTASSAAPSRVEAMDSLEQGLLADQGDSDEDDDDDNVDGAMSLSHRASLLEAIQRTKDKQPGDGVKFDEYHEIR